MSFLFFLFPSVHFVLCISEMTMLIFMIQISHIILVSKKQCDYGYLASTHVKIFIVDISCVNLYKQNHARAATMRRKVYCSEALWLKNTMCIWEFVSFILAGVQFVCLSIIYLLWLIEAEWCIYALVNKPSLVQIMACRLDGAKLLSEQVL